MFSTQATKDNTNTVTAFTDTIMHLLEPKVYTVATWYNLNDNRGSINEIGFKVTTPAWSANDFSGTWAENNYNY
jgi:hypothetical protein